MAIDNLGYLYVTDYHNHCIRKITPGGVVSTLAGKAGSPPDNVDGPATDARFYNPDGIAVDHSGNVYVGDSGNHTIRKITSAGIVSTLAGKPGAGGGANGTGSDARFISPNFIAVDGSGNLYVADASDHTIRKVTPDGIVTAVAGKSGSQGSTDGAGSNALFSFPAGVALDGQGNIYVADAANRTIRKIAPGGVVSTLAGFPRVFGARDGAGMSAQFRNPDGVAVDRQGVVYITDGGNDNLRGITPAGLVSTLAGRYSAIGNVDGFGTNVLFSNPKGVAIDSNGTIYIADSANHTIRKGIPLPLNYIPPQIVESPGSQSLIVGETAILASLASGPPPLRYQWSKDGQVIADETSDTLVLTNVTINDAGTYTVAAINLAGVVPSWAPPAILTVTTPYVTTLAGSGGPGFKDGLERNAQFNSPNDVTIRADGTIYVADTDNHRIRQVSPQGNVVTFSGTGDAGYLDGSSATARFAFPQSVFAGSGGDLFVADKDNNRIRKISASVSHPVSTLAGSGQAGFLDGSAGLAKFDFPSDLVMDSAGSLYVLEFNNHAIRQITPSGDVTTLAGSGVAGYADGSGKNAFFNQPAGMALNKEGNLYVSEWGNQRIRRITPGGLVSTWAGSGQAGFLDGAGLSTRFHNPDDLAVDRYGNVFVADHDNHAIRKISRAGIVTTVAGTGRPGSANGTGRQAMFFSPGGLAIDPAGNVIISDTGNHLIRKITFYTPPAILTQPQSQSVRVGETVTFSVTASGEDHLTYQWRLNGISLAGATNAALVVVDAQAANIGSFTVLVSNLGGVITSAVAAITLLPPAQIVVRTLPTTYEPGIGFMVLLRATPPPNAAAYAVEDTPPIGWTVGVISDGGIYDAANKKVKFGPFFDTLIRNLSYNLQPPLGETGSKEFHGIVLADTQASPIAGMAAMMDAGRISIDCSFSALERAVQMGGSFVLACEAPIFFPHPISVRTNVSISGSTLATLSGGNTVRLFIVEENVQLSLKNLVVRDGFATAAANTNRQSDLNRGTNVYGGAIWNRGGMLTLTNCTFVANSVRGGDGGPDSSSTPTPGAGGAALGGAIMSSNGFVQVEACIFRSNNVRGGTGGSTFTAAGTTGAGGWASGAAIHQTGGGLAISGTTFESNQATAGVTPVSRYYNSSAARGGAVTVERAELQVTGCIFLTNSADNSSADGGAIFASSSPSIDIVNSDFLGNSASGGTERWKDQGNARARGGALHLTNCIARIDSCFWSGNAAIGGLVNTAPYSLPAVHSYGGAIFSDGDVSIQKSSFFTNRCVGASGLSNFAPVSQPGSGYGGAIYNARNMVIENSAFAMNSAIAGVVSAIPGAQFTPPTPSAVIGSGGGLANGGIATLAHCTFAWNSGVSLVTNGFISPAAPGSILNEGTLFMEKTILSHPSTYNVGGFVNDRGENLSSDGTPVFTSPTSHDKTDPLLAPFRYYLGRTPTIALRPGSPALNAATATARFPADQRGEPRPFGSSSDIGAYEATSTATNNVIKASASRSELVVTLFSTPSDRYALLSSTNLVTWQSVLTNSTDNLGRLQWRVPISTEAGARVFQGRRLQP